MKDENKIEWFSKSDSDSMEDLIKGGPGSGRKGHKTAPKNKKNVEGVKKNVLESLNKMGMNLKEAKKRYGHRMCLKGNINTTNFMLFATLEQIEEKCKQLIDDAGEGGGFILSTGDQCGRDTPDANLFKMVEVAKTYGKY